MGKNPSPKAPKTTVQTINTSAAKGSSRKGTRTNGGKKKQINYNTFQSCKYIVI